MHPNETALVAAFLACNTRYKILFALSMLHYERQREMQSVLPEYTPESDWRGMRVGVYDQAKNFPSSLWLRVEGKGTGLVGCNVTERQRLRLGTQSYFETNDVNGANRNLWPLGGSSKAATLQERHDRSFSRRTIGK